MDPGEVAAVEGVADWYYVDTGMYDTGEYGAVYLLDGERPALVDAGIGTHHGRVLDAIDAVGIDRADLRIIALTHVHLDHAGGAGHLVEACPNATVHVHGIGAPHVIDPGRLVEGTKRAVGEQWRYYTDPRPIPESRVRSLDEGDVVDLGNRSLVAHHAPGHAPHQVVYHEPDTGSVFTGDAAGIWVPSIGSLEPTSPPPNFDLEQCLKDVAMIRDLDPDRLCFPHFGPAGTDDLLDRFETVLPDWVATVEATYRDCGSFEATVDRLVEDVAAGAVWGPTKAWYETAVNVRGVLRYLGLEV